MSEQSINKKLSGVINTSTQGSYQAIEDAIRLGCTIEEGENGEIYLREPEVAQLPKINPFRRETFNLTEQARIQKGNPSLAAKLKAEADGD